MQKIILILLISFFSISCQTEKDRINAFENNLEKCIGMKRREIIRKYGRPKEKFKNDDLIFTYEKKNYQNQICKISFIFKDKKRVSKWHYSGYCY